MKHRACLLPGLVVLSLFGVADSWYLAEHALTNTALSCGIAGLSGCNIVAQSPYSHLFGIPLGIYGVLFYAFIFVLSAIALTSMNRWITQLLFGLGVLGMLFSFYFLGLQLFVINALCVYCIGSFIIAAGIFLATLVLWKKLPPRMAVVL